MKTIVVYKSKYGSTRTYAEWIGERLNSRVVEAGSITISDLMEYDTIIYGGGLYAEVIGGVQIITKNLDSLADKKIAIFTTGITPLDCREYYDDMVIAKNFRKGKPDNVRVFNYMGKMILSELTPVHRGALKTLKKIMTAKKNPTDMEKLLITLCDADGDFTDKEAIEELIDYVMDNN